MKIACMSLGQYSVQIDLVTLINSYQLPTDKVAIEVGQTIYNKTQSSSTFQ